MRLLATAFIALGFCNGVWADGLISRLPKDGIQAVFKSTTKVGEDPELIGRMTIASVGKVDVNGQPCRWIEISIASKIGARTPVIKVLINEKDLKEGRNTYEKRIKGYIRQGADRETKQMTKKNSDAMQLFFGKGAEVKKLPSVKVDHPLLGKIECTRTSGKLKFFESRNNDVSFEITRHKSAPFGVVSAKLNIVPIDSEDSPEHLTMTFTLEKTQDGAKSLLPDSK
jgi:hypothetical protein